LPRLPLAVKMISFDLLQLSLRLFVGRPCLDMPISIAGNPTIANSQFTPPLVTDSFLKQVRSVSFEVS